MWTVSWAPLVTLGENEAPLVAELESCVRS